MCMPNNQPLVSVPVITYNSSKTVVETLDSIYAQTYPNIELIVSDDCSQDNIVEIVREWIDKHKERFVRTELITADKNTGISANLNRAEAACQGEWVKSIAGDDLLMPNCIMDCVDYVLEKPETIFLFGKYEVFSENQVWADSINQGLDFSFFNKTREEQLHILLFDGNKICAPTLFYNRLRAKELEVCNDVRIPQLEDYPKWINLLKKGVRFHFIDKQIVLYRIGMGISTNVRQSLQYYKSNRLMHYYYLYPEWYQENADKAIERSVEEECSVYARLLEIESKGTAEIRNERDLLRVENEYLKHQLASRTNSKAYRLGRFLLHPFDLFK